MKKHAKRIGKLTVLNLFMAGFLASPSYAQEPLQTPPTSAGGSAAAPVKNTASSPEKVVLKVGKEQVTQANFDALVSGLGPQMNQPGNPLGRRRIGDQYATLLVLSQQALNDHLDTSPDYLRKMTFQRLQLLANAEYANLTHLAQPKPEEVSQYYTAHAADFEEAQIRKVFVRKKPEGAKEGAPGLSAQDARPRAEAIRKALANGTDAKKVIDDFKSTDVIIDATPRAVRRAQLLADQDKAAFQLKEGELTELEETPQAITFIQVVKHGRKELKDVTQQIERKLAQEKVQAAMDELKKKAGVWMDEEYFPSAPTPAPAVLSPLTGKPAQPGPATAPAPAAQKPGSNPPQKP
jgi:hypothetical protein